MAKPGGLKGPKGPKGPNWWVLVLIQGAGVLIKEAWKHRKEIRDFFVALHKEVRDWWNGKKVAVIGAPAVGKNSLLHRLRGEPVPDQHHETKGASKVSDFRFEHTLPSGKTLSITFRRCMNVGGESEEIRHWMEACRGADVIFYMMTIDDLRNSRYRTDGRIHSDLKWLATSMGNMKRNTVVHILVNKIDLALEDGKGYELLIKEVEPQVTELQNTAQSLFGAYAKRLTGMSLTSMKDDYLFGVTFSAALECVYRALHDEA